MNFWRNQSAGENTVEIDLSRRGGELSSGGSRYLGTRSPADGSRETPFHYARVGLYILESDCTV